MERSKKMEINEALEKYILYLVGEKGLSKNTISNYKEDLDLFFLHFDDIKDTSSLDDSLLEEYAIYQGERGLTSSSIARRLSSLKNFFLFLDKEKIANINISRLDLPKKQRKLPEVLSTEEISSLLSSIDTSKKEGSRDLAMLLTMYSSGLRVSELLDLKIEDISFNKRIILVRSGKGNKQRSVPINQDCLDVILNYIDTSRKEFPNSKKSPYLFLNKFGNPMSRNYFFVLVKEYAALAGINKNIHPHTLRHSFATSLLENGINIVALKDMLGHSHLETTQIYTKVSTKKAFKDYSSSFDK